MLTNQIISTSLFYDKKVRKKKDKKAGTKVDIPTMESILLAHAWLL